MADCPQINNTTIIGTSAVSYDSTPLPCTGVSTCDDLNTILTKFDNVICSAINSVNILSEEIMNITEDIMIITEEIENINNQIFICCPICDFTITATELPVCEFTVTATELPTCDFTGNVNQVPDLTTTTTSSSSSTSTSTSTTSSSTSTSTSSTSSTTTTTTAIPTNPLSGTWDLDSVNANVNITSINNLSGDPVSCVGATLCTFPIVSGGGQYVATPPTSDGTTPISTTTTATLVLNLSWISVIPGATYYFTIDVTGQSLVTQFVTYGTPVITLNVAGLITGSEDVNILFTGTL